MLKTGQKFEKLVKIVKKLRKECPWDKKQTIESLKPYLVEEVYEALEAIDQKDGRQLAEEVGDMLLHVVMLSVFAAEIKEFNVDQVIDLISAKMIRRHPHVFGKEKAKDQEQVWRKWEEIKKIEAQGKREKGKKGKGMLGGIPKSLPALYRAEKVQKRAARVGFDWDQVAGAWEKVHEELAEVHAALKSQAPSSKSQTNPKSKISMIKEEIGDLLFAIVNVARKLNLDAEETLQAANNKFVRRFSTIEEALHEKKLTLAEMDELWEKAKSVEK